MEKMIVQPDPERMIEGLRDTGYEFTTAVSDLIDNSIAADAETISIHVEMDYGGSIIVSVIDNGTGMNREGLINAMKYGSPPRPDKRSLGKFGLGLKTASTAFCRSLSVISRSAAKDSVLKAVWDLDHVAEVGEWELILSDPSEDELNSLEVIAENSPGTLVKWTKVDRLLKEYSEPSGAYARNALNRRVNDLVKHASMVYQRFLSLNDEREEKKVEIWINGSRIEPWDPFCTGESELVAKDTIPVGREGDDEGILGEFNVQAFVLPRQDEFSSEEVAKTARITNANQGIYIYRENRLIHYADWLGMYAKEPHGSLLRVEFSFGADLDDALHVDLKKSKISLNESLYRWLKDDFLPAPRRAAQQRYRKGKRKKSKEAAASAHDSSNRNIRNNEKDINKAGINIVDPKSNEVDIQNPYGITRFKLKLSTAHKPGEVFVQPVDGIVDGQLWLPALIDGHQGVRELALDLPVHPLQRKPRDQQHHGEKSRNECEHDVGEIAALEKPIDDVAVETL